MSGEVDVCVVGSGPAGLAAAAAARRAGAGRVVVVDRETSPGGILPQCIHDGFGLEEFGEAFTGPEYAERAAGDAACVGVEFWQGTTALALGPGPELVLVGGSGRQVLRPRTVVVATGCRERTRGNILLPGTRPAGVFTAGTAQRLINVMGVLPGRRAVVMGSGDVGLIVARRLHLEGCEVEGVYEILTRPGGLVRNVVQCLHDHGIPLHLGHTVVEVHGDRRLEGVTVAAVDADGRVRQGTRRRVPCDTLITSLGLIPELEILRGLTDGTVDESMRTGLERVFLCGNAAFVHDTVDCVTACGRLAGRAAARHAAGLRWPRRVARVEAGEGVRQVVPGALSELAEAARFHLRLDVEGFDVEVQARARDRPLARWRLRAVSPTQAVALTAGPARLERLRQDRTLAFVARPGKEEAGGRIHRR